MKKAGIALIALGFYCVLFAFNMDVVVGTTYNIGLMNERQNVVYLSGIMFLAGIILFGFGFSAKEESKNLKSFGLWCFLSPVLLLAGIKTIVSVQESIRQENVRKQNAIDTEKYTREIKEITQRQMREKEAIKEAERKAEKANQAKIPKENSDRFIDNIDGTVTHKTTGLTWQRCLVGQTWNGTTCVGEPEYFPWAGVIQLTNNATYKNNWRLPTKEELLSLVYCSDGKYLTPRKENSDSICNKGVDSPTINTNIFPSTPSRYFWTASSLADDSSIAWTVGFGSGDIFISSRDNTSGSSVEYVRLVRK